MKQLFAPWRMQYIQATQEEAGCFLCRAAAAATDAQCAEALVLWRDERTLAVLNRFPYSNGHVLLAPVAHQPDLAAISATERAALMEALVRVVAALRQALSPHGFNIGLNVGADAGAGLSEHLHFHVVPRWRNDTNYMPVIADVKVIPQTLEETRRLLREALEHAV